MFLVDARGHIVHANVSAQNLLSEGHVLRSNRGQLIATNALVNKSLREVLAIVNQGDAALCVKGIALPLSTDEGDRYVAHVLPLTSGARLRAGVAYTAVAALFVRRTTLETPSAPEIIGRTFKLTPTELRVLLAVVEVGGVPEVAVALGVAETTCPPVIKSDWSASICATVIKALHLPRFSKANSAARKPIHRLPSAILNHGTYDVSAGMRAAGVARTSDNVRGQHNGWLGNDTNTTKKGCGRCRNSAYDRCCGICSERTCDQRASGFLHD